MPSPRTQNPEFQAPDSVTATKDPEEERKKREQEELERKKEEEVMAYKDYMVDNIRWGYSSNGSTASSVPWSYSASQDVKAAVKKTGQAVDYAVQV